MFLIGVFNDIFRSLLKLKKPDLPYYLRPLKLSFKPGLGGFPIGFGFIFVAAVSLTFGF